MLGLAPEIKKGEEEIRVVLTAMPVSKLLEYIGKNAKKTDIKKIRNYDKGANYAMEIIEARE